MGYKDFIVILMTQKAKKPIYRVFHSPPEVNYNQVYTLKLQKWIKVNSYTTKDKLTAYEKAFSLNKKYCTYYGVVTIEHNIDIDS